MRNMLYGVLEYLAKEARVVICAEAAAGTAVVTAEGKRGVVEAAARVCAVNRSARCWIGISEESA